MPKSTRKVNVSEAAIRYAVKLAKAKNGVSDPATKKLLDWFAPFLNSWRQRGLDESEVYYVFWTSIESYDAKRAQQSNCSFLTYLYWQLRGALSASRAHDKYLEFDAEIRLRSDWIGWNDILDTIAVKELDARIVNRLAQYKGRTSPVLRVTIWQYMVEGLAPREIAEIIGVPARRVSSLIYSIRRIAQEVYREWQAELAV